MRLGVVVVALIVAASLVCVAAESPKVAFEAKDKPIEQAMSDIGKSAGVLIVCEPDLKQTVTGSFTSAELESVLNVLTKSVELKWQKIYLPSTDDQKPAADEVRRRAEAVAAVSGGPIIVCDPTGKQKVFVEQEAAAPSIDPEKLGLKPVYIVFKPRASAPVAKEATGDDALAQFQSLEKQRMELMAKMTPEERTRAMQEEMNLMMTLHPEARQQMLLDRMNARRNMDPQMQEQYRNTMRDTFRSMREQGLIPEGERGGGGGNRGRRGD